MWNKTPVSQSARTHGLGWRTAQASSIDEKSFIYIFKATSAPPRAGTTGILRKGSDKKSTPRVFFECLCYGSYLDLCRVSTWNLDCLPIYVLQHPNKHHQTSPLISPRTPFAPLPMQRVLHLQPRTSNWSWGNKTGSMKNKLQSWNGIYCLPRDVLDPCSTSTAHMGKE